MRRSDAWAGRFIGVFAPTPLTSSDSLSDGLSSVHTGPATTALTRMRAEQTGHVRPRGG